MPNSTPVYGITYPCGGDTINASAIRTFAETLDAALAQGTAELADTVNRPNAMIRWGVPQPTGTVPVGVATNIVYQAELYDNDGMADLAVNNDRLTCQTGGVYFASSSFTLSNVTTLTGCTIIITVNGTEFGRWKARPQGSSNFMECSLAIPVDLFPGDILRTQALWTGTGGPANISNHHMAASLICIH